MNKFCNVLIEFSLSELPGFETVNLENVDETTLSSEDLESRRKQLWLIKVPYEVHIICHLSC